MSAGTLPTPHLSDAEIRHIFVEVSEGRGNCGDFMIGVAAAVRYADPFNFELIREAACSVIDKYELRKYLDTFEGGEATA